VTDDEIPRLLARARELADRGDDAAAKDTYVALLRKDSTHFSVLNELAALAHASGHLSAARTAYEQAIRFHPDNPLGRVNLANLLMQDGDLARARAELEAALAADPDFAPAHQGLARVLCDLGEETRAAPHWQKGFAGHALVSLRYRGKKPGVPVLLLVSAKRGNIATQMIVDDTEFAVTALYAEFYDKHVALPSHTIVFNAIGDSDLCGEALARAEDIVRISDAPIINHPSSVRQTGRIANAERLGKLPGVVAPAMRRVTRSNLKSARELGFPLLLRAPGFHNGRHFLRVEREEELPEAAASLPGEEFIAMQVLDARGADGMARKYRVMFVDGEIYPLHLAISRDWKVHYVTADMAIEARHREEEKGFLEDMTGVLGPAATDTLRRISRELKLDYAGIDFGLDASGRLLLFEANATMVAVLPAPDPKWDYRRGSVTRIRDAVKRLVLDRAERKSSQ
jgi:hypothetical protein